MTDPRSDLRADCARCFALCCVVPAFSASADFAIDKGAGTPCRNLLADFGCGIHDALRPSGFAGCTVYDCFGAGQRVAQVTFGGRDWRTSPELAADMFAAFPAVRLLHELLWYLAQALTLVADGAMPDELTGPTHTTSERAPLRTTLAAAYAETELAAGGGPDALASLDADARRDDVNVLLHKVSEAVRHAGGGLGADLRGADLAGADLRGRDLRRASLRGALLVGADLRGLDLVLADLTGADLRGADLRGADLSEAIFVTTSQLRAAVGDATTSLPPTLARPTHWHGG